MTVLTTQDFDDHIKEGLVLVDFFAEWCGPCHALSPIIESIATSDEFKDKVKIYKLDVDAAPEISARFQVMSIPTVILFKNGEKVETIVGAQPASRYTDILNTHLK